MDSLPWSCVSTGARVADAAGCCARAAGAGSSSVGNAACICNARLSVSAASTATVSAAHCVQAPQSRATLRKTKISGHGRLRALFAGSVDARQGGVAEARVTEINHIVASLDTWLACPAVKVNNASTYDSYY